MVYTVSWLSYNFFCLKHILMHHFVMVMHVQSDEEFFCRKDGNYKRTVIACFIQAVYLLELDRQENRSNKENALAPKWWIPFKYKLVQTLIDERDGSIFGAILEWDRSAAMADLVLIRPSGAPRAVLALRGTLLKARQSVAISRTTFGFLLGKA